MFPLLDLALVRRAARQVRSSTAYRTFILLCHSASQVSGWAGANASAFNGSLGLSAPAVASSSTVFKGTCTGHSSNAFESPGLPSYQHFRPSMRRQDQYVATLDG